MSSLLSSDDLNDFIKPSVACIKPVENFKQDDNGSSSIQFGEDEQPLEVFMDGTAKSLEPAQISLSDCLACSGCITSAEEILVAQHSHQELLNALKNNTDGNIKFVASISHQSRSSLALAFNLSIEMMDLVLLDLFVNRLGFLYVVGTELGRLLSLQQSIAEIENFKSQRTSSKDIGPLMNSVCPGWVLYVEKTHPEIIPNMSRIKSPQQITGCLLKNSASKSLNVPLEKIYHLSIMPCFDKKLEAARPEENAQENTPPDVDCVITAKEFVQLMNDENIPFDQYINELKGSQEFVTSLQNLDDVYRKFAPDLFKFGAESWYSNLGSCSGGYADNYLKYLQAKHSSKNTEIVKIKGRNDDIAEYRLVDLDSEDNVLGSVAIINGFRNIQNLIRKVGELNGTKKVTRKKGALAARRRAKHATTDSEQINNKTTDKAFKFKNESADGIKCDYVEVMACPGGCINGGGQISAPEVNESNFVSSQAAKVWQSKAEVKYKSIKTIEDINNEALFNSLRLYLEEFCNYFGISEKRLTQTYFKKVETTNVDDPAIALSSKW